MEKYDLEDTLLHFVRHTVGLKGTKDNGVTGCDTVVMSSWNAATGKFTHRAVVASTIPLPSCHLTNITTVEGIGEVVLVFIKAYLIRNNRFYF